MTKPTCPKYTQLFLATLKRRDCIPIVLCTVADTEEEARDTSSCWSLTSVVETRTKSNLRDSGCRVYGLNPLTLEMLKVHNV